MQSRIPECGTAGILFQKRTAGFYQFVKGIGRRSCTKSTYLPLCEIILNDLS